MGRGGNLCYFGDPEQAIPFFNDFVKSQGHHYELDGFAEIYIELDKPPEENQGIKPEAYCQRCAEFFRNHPSYQTYVERQLGPLNGSPSGITPQSPKTVSGKSSAPQNQSPQQATPSPWGQISVLLQRDIQLVFADKFNLALALLTAPIGIGLITFAIRDREPFILPTGPDPTLAPLALRVLFVFTCAAIWVGLSGSLQTIVRESAIYLRERLVNLGLVPYLGSKVLVLGGLALIQTLLMTAVILLGFQSPEPQLISWTMGVSVTTFLNPPHQWLSRLSRLLFCQQRNPSQYRPPLTFASSNYLFRRLIHHGGCRQIYLLGHVESLVCGSLWSLSKRE